MSFDPNIGRLLERCASGDYGVCLECEEEISRKRLNATPWATRCIVCQERADQDRQSDAAARDVFFLHAA